MIFKNALLADGSRKDILTQNGKIAQISSKIEGAPVIDCSNYLVMPGMIDVHVHFRDPGFLYKETAETGTKAALRGGICAIIDMPNTQPLCTTLQALEEKKAIYGKHAYCSYGFNFGGDARDNSLEVRKAQNFASLKIFLNESTGHMLVTDDKVLDKLFASSTFISVHAEGEAVEKAIYFARKHNNILYLCHISLEEELIAIKKAKEQKMPVYAEVTPHHILFDQSLETNLLMMKPRLRSLRDKQMLLQALDEGLIDTWGTDHAPHLKEEKETGIVYGIEGIEFALENLITLAKNMNWSMEKVQNLYSSNPAHIFRIEGKGSLSIGIDADIVLVDPHTSYTVSSQDIISRCGWSPYEGHIMDCKIHSTYIGGECVYKEGIFTKSPYIKELTFKR